MEVLLVLEPLTATKTSNLLRTSFSHLRTAKEALSTGGPFQNTFFVLLIGVWCLFYTRSVFSKMGTTLKAHFLISKLATKNIWGTSVEGNIRFPSHSFNLVCSCSFSVIKRVRKVFCSKRNWNHLKSEMYINKTRKCVPKNACRLNNYSAAQKNQVKSTTHQWAVYFEKGKTYFVK